MSSRDSSDQVTLAEGRSRTRLRAAWQSEAPPPAGEPKTIGRYEVLKVIGKGAMGVVYQARDPWLDRIVAIKTIVATPSLHASARRAFLERFEREAKAAARISHPSIVTIFDVGLDADAPFMVMEYLPGETLGDRLDRVRMPLGQAVQCARDLASALGVAHRERIVHRDVKPANVLSAGDGRWKLADFGIVRVPDSDLTQAGIFMGTPGYSPPEAIREGRYTAQADVFAWGAVFYELLCGRVPYEGPDVNTTNGYVLKAPPPSPLTYDERLPEPLAEIALLAMAHDPSHRYVNGAEVEIALSSSWESCLARGLVPLSALSSAAVVPSPRAAAQPAPKAAPSPPHMDAPPAPGGEAAAVPSRLAVSGTFIVSPERSRPREDSAQVVTTDDASSAAAQPAPPLWSHVSLVALGAVIVLVSVFYLWRVW
jgi:serine/threonine-protein kinase